MTGTTERLEQCDIPVSGMTCAACSARVQRALELTPGVNAANVNLMTNQATVDFDPALIAPESMVEVIRHAGYGAEVPGADLAPDDMGLMLVPTGWGMPLINIILLGLSLPVVFWAGRHFYTRAWTGFRHHSADMSTLIAVGTGSAFVFSVLMTLASGWFTAQGLEPHVYYEAVIWVITLVLVGNFLEAKAKGRNRTPHAWFVMARKWRSRSPSFRWKTFSSCDQARRSRPTVWSFTALATWTSQCLPASRSPSTRSRAIP
jgi:cation transport ATPase